MKKPDSRNTSISWQTIFRLLSYAEPALEISPSSGTLKAEVVIHPTQDSAEVTFTTGGKELVEFWVYEKLTFMAELAIRLPSTSEKDTHQKP